MERDDEVKGSGNSLDFGERWLDVRIGRMGSVDRLHKETPVQSTYVFAGNNPILYIDKNGDFKLKYDRKLLEENGITQQELVRFEQIIKNVGNIIKDNPHALEVIANSTGLSQEQIMEDTEFGKGPTINILPFGPGARGGQDGIVIDVNVVKALVEIDAGNSEELSEQVLGAALLILHEYTHYGDQVTNDGKNTGQFNRDSNGKRGETNFGKQKFKVTATGHRGTDTEVLGFGIQTSIGPDNKIIALGI